MLTGEEHLDASAHAHHAALDGGILEARRQSALFAPVAYDRAPAIGEFELEAPAAAARAHRVPGFALLEDEEPHAVLVRAPAVCDAPRRESVAPPPRLPAQIGVELRQCRQRQRILARRSRRGEELGALGVDEARGEIGGAENPVLAQPGSETQTWCR